VNEEPVYNIGIVARMTGVPENTLRVWERRYDFPQSARTEGGHRLYAPHEVARIQWVKQRIDEGMQTRNAIHALEQVEAAGRFPDLLNGTPAVQVIPDASGEAIQEHLFAALADHDEDRANQITGEALAAFSIEQLILSVIGPIFTAFGQAWAEGRVNIATEHFATNYLRQQLLLWLHAAPPAYPVRAVILACAPGELHEGGLLMLGVMLRRLRWPVLYLGQSTVLPDLAAFVQKLKPSIVVFAAMTDQTAQALTEWPRWLPDADHGGPLIAYGGYVFAQTPAWIASVPGLYLGDTLASGLEKLDNLLHDLNPLLR
jgi:DNA-binding transcriptional MerR regulator